MANRFHFRLMAATALVAVLIGVIATHFRAPLRAKPKMPVAAIREARRPNFHKLLTEYAMTLAEFPCPPESGDTGQSILVVQEPVLWKDPTESQSGGFLRSSLLWILKGEQNEPFENAAVLGTFPISPPWVSPYVAATTAFDSQRNRYWMAMVSGGSRLNVEIYSFSPREIIARSRSSLLESSTDWPLYRKPVAFAQASTQEGFVVSDCRLVTSVTMKVNAVAENPNLIIQAHSTRDWNNEQTQVKFWTWQYAIEEKSLSLLELAGVPRPEPVLTERDELNRTHREKWMSLIHDIENRKYQQKNKQPKTVKLSEGMTANEISKERQGGWQEEKCRLVCREHQGYVIAEAKSAVYDIKHEGVKGAAIPVTVFFGSRPEFSWVGPMQDLYIETANGIVGLQIQSAGILLWTESLSQDAARTLQSATKLEELTEFFEGVTASDLANAYSVRDMDGWMKRGTDMRRAVKSSWFFDIGPGAQGGIAKILGAEIEGDQLRLSMENETRPLRADVWIDISTRKAVKGVITHDPYGGKWPPPE